MIDVEWSNKLYERYLIKIWTFKKKIDILKMGLYNKQVPFMDHPLWGESKRDYDHTKFSFINFVAMKIADFD